jgi:hypothetical protein
MPKSSDPLEPPEHQQQKDTAPAIECLGRRVEREATEQETNDE